jgi:hypothetical protein
MSSLQMNPRESTVWSQCDLRLRKALSNSKSSAFVWLRPFEEICAREIHAESACSQTGSEEAVATSNLNTVPLTQTGKFGSSARHSMYLSHRCRSVCQYPISMQHLRRTRIFSSEGESASEGCIHNKQRPPDCSE